MEGRVFDAQVVLSPKDSPAGKQLLQYVCVRVTRMDNVDVALFDRDWNNAIYFFAINADEQVYLRYGGRESEDPDTYNSLDSLEVALREGLVLHQRYLAGDFKPEPRPKPLFPARFHCWSSAPSPADSASNATLSAISRIFSAIRTARSTSSRIYTARPISRLSASIWMCRRDWWSKRRRPPFRLPA